MSALISKPHSLVKTTLPVRCILYIITAFSDLKKKNPTLNAHKRHSNFRYFKGFERKYLKL